MTQAPTAAAIDTPWLKVPEAAAYSRRSTSLLLAALRSGELVGSQTKKGGTWTVHRDQLDAWMRGEKADVVIPAVARRRAGVA